MALKLLFFFSFFFSFNSIFSITNLKNRSCGGLHKDTIPSFVYMPTSSDYSWGVSDPDVDTLLAREQAIQRAVFLYALSQKSDFQMVSDYYSKTERAANQLDVSAEKILSYSRIHIDSAVCHFDVVDEYRSASGEYFVNLHIAPFSTEQRTISVEGELMRLLTAQSHEESQQKARFTVLCHGKEGQDLYNYSYKSNGSKCWIETTFRDFHADPQARSMWYEACGVDNQETNGYKASYGLWSVVVGALTSDLSFLKSKQIDVRQVSEVFDKQLQQLYREKVSCQLTCRPVIYGVHDNKVRVGCEIRVLSQKEK